MNDNKLTRGDWGMLIAAVAWLATYFLGRGITESETASVPLKIAAALLPILPFAVFFYFAQRSRREMDELEIRVQLEALAVAFPLSILFLMVFGLIGEALDLTLERHVWFYLPIFYFAGVALAWRRYR